MQQAEQSAQIEILKEKIKDLRGRLPAHSVKPRMLRELEELEEELEILLEEQAKEARS